MMGKSQQKNVQLIVHAIRMAGSPSFGKRCFKRTVHKHLTLRAGIAEWWL
jgi:hypothetical protein